jgi:hypothetical protein
MSLRSLPIITATLLVCALAGCGHEAIPTYTGSSGASSEQTFQAMPASLVHVMRHSDASATPSPAVQPSPTASSTVS